MFIPDPDSDPGVKKAPDSGFATLVFFEVCGTY
jgi:hypothetical protein